MSRKAGIEVVDLAKSFGGRLIFSDLSLRVGKGEFVALVGPSGAGKTTLLRCLVRLVDADDGEIWVAGNAMRRLGGRGLSDARRQIGFVFQQFNLVRRRSALDNVIGGRLASMPFWRVALSLYDVGDLRAAEWALARVGLRDRSLLRADRLSGGQQQRVAIARALVQESSVLLADEPIASLDPDAARGVLALLRSLARDDGLTVLCSLHQHDLAREYADRVVAIEDLGGARAPRPARQSM
jgi:phosphonate transport system ATP-binding protein